MIEMCWIKTISKS